MSTTVATVGTTVATDAGQSVVDGVARDIEHLAHLASVVLNMHVNDGGLCAVCSVVFPCDLAVVGRAQYGAAVGAIHERQHRER